MSKLRQYGDALERTVWTAAEGAGAVGLVAGYQALPLADIPAGYVVLVTVLVGALLAAGKGIIATNVGNGTASTLPNGLEPVPASVAEKLVETIERTEADKGQGGEVNAPTEVVPLDEVPLEPVVVDDDHDGRDDVTGRYVSKG